MFEAFRDKTPYQVVINHEEQYSLWPKDLQVPTGWKSVGVSGNKQACTRYIEEVWTDLRPLKLHNEMAQKAETMMRKG